MKRLFVALVALALALSACAVGAPKPPTSPTGTSIVLNADVVSSIDGPTAYWFRYGERGDLFDQVAAIHAIPSCGIHFNHTAQWGRQVWP